MKINYIITILLATGFNACNSDHIDKSGHASDALHTGHEKQKFQYTIYTEQFEVFAEADAFVQGENANILAHFSSLPGFKAVDTGKITAILRIGDKEIKQILQAPTRKGIYSFDLTPPATGKGDLTFEIVSRSGTFPVIVPGITVFAHHEDAAAAAANSTLSRTNTAVFTKEQSWKIDFATGFPEIRPFGQVIRTTAQVQAPLGNEIVVTAKTNGLVNISDDHLVEGNSVTIGQLLCSVTGSSLTDNNISVRFTEARNNYVKAQADYERIQTLAEEKIVSAKDLLAAQNLYENAKAIFDNLNQSFNGTGQTVSAPMSGYLRQVHVKNGMFVEAGQPLATITQDRTLDLTARVPQRYARALEKILTINIRNSEDNRTWTLDELNGRILSVGKVADAGNFLLPVTVRIDNRGGFINGGFVQLYITTMIDSRAMVVPCTALMEEQGLFFVWGQITPELFEKREVRIGASDGISTAITGGIDSSDRIVTRGAMMIKLAQATGALDAHSGHVH